MSFLAPRGLYGQQSTKLLKCSRYQFVCPSFFSLFDACFCPAYDDWENEIVTNNNNNTYIPCQAYCRRYNSYSSRASKIAESGQHNKIEWWNSKVESTMTPFPLHTNDSSRNERTVQKWRHKTMLFLVTRPSPSKGRTLPDLMWNVAKTVRKLCWLTGRYVSAKRVQRPARVFKRPGVSTTCARLHQLQKRFPARRCSSPLNRTLPSGHCLLATFIDIFVKKKVTTKERVFALLFVARSVHSFGSKCTPMHQWNGSGKRKDKKYDQTMCHKAHVADGAWKANVTTIATTKDGKRINIHGNDKIVQLYARKK